MKTLRDLEPSLQIRLQVLVWTSYSFYLYFSHCFNIKFMITFICISFNSLLHITFLHWSVIINLYSHQLLTTQISSVLLSFLSFSLSVLSCFSLCLFFSCFIHVFFLVQCLYLCIHFVLSCPFFRPSIFSLRSPHYSFAISVVFNSWAVSVRLRLRPPLHRVFYAALISSIAKRCVPLQLFSCSMFYFVG
jgi:hypothetical protein